MDEKLLIALVAGGSAILGSVIPTVLNFWNNQQQRNFEIRKLLLERQKAAYFEFLGALQSIINEQTSQNRFLALQAAGNQVAVYGDKNTSQRYLDYYSAIVSAARGQRQPLSSEEHKSHQTQIMNAMRKGMGLDKIDSFEVIGFCSNPSDSDRAS